MGIGVAEGANPNTPGSLSGQVTGDDSIDMQGEK
jgi:hypothetical protein